MTLAEEAPPLAGTPDLAADLRTLLAGVAQGEEAPFNALYHSTSARIYGLVYRIVLDRALSEEVTQEVFLQVWRKAAEYRPDLGTPLTWLLTLAHRRAVDRVRSEQASRARLNRWTTAEVQTPFDQVAEAVLDNHEAAALKIAVGALTEKQRQVIELAYYGGLTYAQVAQVLGAPDGTVKTRIRQGLGRLKDALEPGSSMVT
ncbi:sigma-70 family RNA polymerase sigma factor [Arthrobacter sp. JZ12]|uniref:ECF RNA polymerase sigma factor SigK n=1 Tax=Arthrobacter sp. JZ12 TaxID=2654190 RepID=UPI002B45E667|nr:ECF RNA polymerase sigma factor SigK [Arthrobacter sp. JZ12]WRH23837.1 sigma-70 family RNA polymerase sigma factor [Arthrobacter sp. JZ12]